MTDLAVIVREPLSGMRTTLFGGKAEDVATRAAIAFGIPLADSHFGLMAGFDELPAAELVGRTAPEYELSRVRSPL